MLKVTPTCVPSLYIQIIMVHMYTGIQEVDGSNPLRCKMELMLLQNVHLKEAFTRK